MTRSNGLITTAILIELPAQVFCGTSVECPDTRKLTGGAIFLVNGSADALISPSCQALPAQLVGLQSNSAYYEAAPRVRVPGVSDGVDDDQLRGDSYAHRAFVSGTGELFREIVNWSNHTGNIQPSTDDHPAYSHPDGPRSRRNAGREDDVSGAGL